MDRKGARRTLVMAAAGLLAVLPAVTGALTDGAAAATRAAPAHRSPWKPTVAAAGTDWSRPARPAPGGGSRWASFRTTSNWAGYVATGQTYTSVSGAWTVPAVQTSTGDTASGTWIGIDGFANGSVIQTGTAQNSTSGRTSYFAWYELYPAAPVTIGSVVPGDVMQASIVQNSPGNWTISLTDVTSGQTASGSGAYNGQGSSAEWIEEAPTSGRTGVVATLANFGTAHFSNASANGNVPAGDALTAVAIADRSGTIVAYPGSLDGTQGAFDVNYGSPSSPPPTSTTTVTTPPSNPTSPSSVNGVSCPTGADRPVQGDVTSIAAMRSAAGCDGYWLVTAQGAVTSFGAATTYGDLSGVTRAPVIAIHATPDGLGYWLVTSDGAVRAFGGARSFGDMSGKHINGAMIAMAATPDGGGYWLVGSDGGIFTFGNAPFFGSTGAMRLNRPVVGIAPAPGGQGYWLVASDGGIFAFGTAPFLGSMGGTSLNKPVTGMTADPAGRGYRMVATDGGIFSFGAPFFGSLGARPPAAGIRAMAPSVDGNGYYMLGTDGSVYSFGNATFLGNAV